MPEGEARFFIGQVIHHARFDYRGVIYDVDPCFDESDEWYETMAKSKPPKDAPWYHVLVHGAGHTTYVVERNLTPDNTAEPISHPALSVLFGSFTDGKYVPVNRSN